MGHRCLGSVCRVGARAAIPGAHRDGTTDDPTRQRSGVVVAMGGMVRRRESAPSLSPVRRCFAALERWRSHHGGSASRKPGGASDAGISARRNQDVEAVVAGCQPGFSEGGGVLRSVARFRNVGCRHPGQSAGSPRVCRDWRIPESLVVSATRGVVAADGGIFGNEFLGDAVVRGGSGRRSGRTGIPVALARKTVPTRAIVCAVGCQLEGPLRLGARRSRRGNPSTDTGAGTDESAAQVMARRYCPEPRAGQGVAGSDESASPGPRTQPGLRRPASRRCVWPTSSRPIGAR